MVMSMMVLILLLQEHLQDLLSEKEQVETPKYHCRLRDIIVLRAETKSLWAQENTVNLSQ